MGKTDLIMLPVIFFLVVFTAGLIVEQTGPAHS